MHYREVRSGEAVASTRQNQVPHTRPCDRRGTGQDYQVIQIILVCIHVHAKGPHKWPCEADRAIFVRVQQMKKQI